MSQTRSPEPGANYTGTATTGGVTVALGDPSSAVEVYAASGDLSVLLTGSTYISIPSGTSWRADVRVENVYLKGDGASAAYEVSWLKAL